MFTYKISNGELLLNGAFVGTGYSGRANCRNDPTTCGLHDFGPIPPGLWYVGPAFDDGHKGPCVMRLTPAADTNTLGRSGFLIHGDNANHDASEGCIILGPSIRKEIAASHDKELTVIP